MSPRCCRGLKPTSTVSNFSGATGGWSTRVTRRSDHAASSRVMPNRVHCGRGLKPTSTFRPSLRDRVSAFRSQMSRSTTLLWCHGWLVHPCYTPLRPRCIKSSYAESSPLWPWVETHVYLQAVATRLRLGFSLAPASAPNLVRLDVQGEAVCRLPRGVRVAGRDEHTLLRLTAELNLYLPASRWPAPNAASVRRQNSASPRSRLRSANASSAVQRETGSVRQVHQIFA